MKNRSDLESELQDAYRIAGRHVVILELLREDGSPPALIDNEAQLAEYAIARAKVIWRELDSAE